MRAGLIEPLAKAGQLNVVVATMGLAAGINFSMRSVLITDTRYLSGNFERQVEPDELLQMFGRAGRRGLDDTGYVLFTPDQPRLSFARPRQLKRATQVDWPSLISVMAAAARAAGDSSAETFTAGERRPRLQGRGRGEPFALQRATSAARGRALARHRSETVRPLGRCGTRPFR